MSYTAPISVEPAGAAGSVRLTWRALEGCKSYHVFFRRENNAFKKINTTSNLSVVISGVDDTALCRFKVCGVNSLGEPVTVGEADNSFMIKRVKLLTMGSVNLELAFADSAKLSVDDRLRKLSPLSVFFPNKAEACDDSTDLDLTKTAGEYIDRSDAEYFILDFYGAAINPIAKWGDTFVTENDELLNSEYFKSHGELYEKLPRFLPESVVKPLMDIFAARLLKRFQNSRIILVRFALPKYYAVDRHVRIGGGHGEINAYIRMLEDMFIEAVHPITADISHEYFGDYEKSGEKETVMDRFYLARLAKIVEDVARDGIEGYYNDGEDINIKLDRIAYYYDSVTARGFYATLFDRSTAAGQIMLRTSRDFVCENRELLKDIMQHGFKTVYDVYRYYDFGGDRSVKRVFKVLSAMERGKLNAVSFAEVLDVAGKYERLRRPLSSMIGTELEKGLGRVIVITERNMMFMLKAAYDLWDGISVRTINERVDEYLRICAQIPVDIWGSCVSREPMNRSAVACVDKYIFKNSVMWAFDPPVRVREGFFDGIDRFGSIWRRSVTDEVFNRRAAEMIERGIGKWIIVDFYDLSSQMARYNGSCFAVDNFIKRSGFFAEIAEETELFYLDAQRDKGAIYAAAERLARLLTERYGDRIILNKVRLNTRYRDLDGNICPLDNRTVKASQQVITLCEERFAELTGCYVIDITKHCISDDSFPLGGAHAAHYEEIYYRGAAAYIDYIVRVRPSQRIFDKL